MYDVGSIQVNTCNVKGLNRFWPGCANATLRPRPMNCAAAWPTCCWGRSWRRGLRPDPGRRGTPPGDGPMIDSEALAVTYLRQWAVSLGVEDLLGRALEEPGQGTSFA